MLSFLQLLPVWALKTSALMFKDRKRGRALPPNGWIGENKALKKRQVKNVIKTRGKNAWPYLVPLLNQLNDHGRSEKKRQ